MKKPVRRGVVLAVLGAGALAVAGPIVAAKAASGGWGAVVIDAEKYSVEEGATYTLEQLAQMAPTDSDGERSILK